MSIEEATKIVEANRSAAYRELSDPIFFKYQAGEANKEEWLAARARVVEENQYPEETE